MKPSDDRPARRAGVIARTLLPSAALLLTAALAHAQPADKGVPARLACSGSEPFWSLAIEGDRAVYHSGAGGAAHTATEYTGKAAPIANRRPAAAAWRGVAPNGASVLVAVIVPAQCTVPSGDNLPWQIWLSLPQGTAVTGCCQ